MAAAVRPPQTQSKNQSQVPFPNQATPLVDAEGMLTAAWFPFLRSLWVKTGSGFLGTGTIAVLEQQPDGRLQVLDASTGASLGFLAPTAK